MISLLLFVFIIGYVFIALEHPLRVNKTATALLLAAGCWVVYISGTADPVPAVHSLSEHLAGVSEILFFLLGAMAIVELVSAHNGFSVVTAYIRTDSKRKLLWITGFITFFLSAVLDNLTSSIVMVTLLRKIIPDRGDRMVFAGIVIIAANAGGAWSPIGDITTTMLWIGGQVTAVNIIKMLFVPSLISLLVPLAVQSFFIRGKVMEAPGYEPSAPSPHSRLIFFAGAGALMFVPVFKAITHLPPYMGILFGLGVLWVLTELLHHKHEGREHLKIQQVLSKIDSPSILFFLGILLAVGALETAGVLHAAAAWLETSIGNNDVIITLLGLLSAVIDNVPLTAACMGMYDLAVYPPDSKIWEMLAYAVGTGGSCLIIGSAAGVVVMGMEKISFFWYLKKIGLTALAGYLAGILAYLALYAMQH